MSLEDRAFYIGRCEVFAASTRKICRPSSEELGFSGPGEPCSDPDDENMARWYGDDDQQADGGGGRREYGCAEDAYAITLTNERIKAEDGAP